MPKHLFDVSVGFATDLFNLPETPQILDQRLPSLKLDIHSATCDQYESKLGLDKDLTVIETSRALRDGQVFGSVRLMTRNYLSDSGFSDPFESDNSREDRLPRFLGQGSHHDNSQVDKPIREQD